MQTALLFALPEEYASFKRAKEPWQLIHRTPFRTFLHTALSCELVLVETGMGQKQLLEALSWLLGKTRPDLIIAAGFAGSLSPDLVVGAVCLGEAFSYVEEDVCAHSSPEITATSFQAAAFGAWDGAPGASEADPTATFRMEPGAKTGSRLIQVCRQYRLHRTRMVTVNQPQPKPLLARKFAQKASIVDMESYFAVRFCYERQIPFLGVRAVSDGLWDEIDFDLGAISDARGRVKIPRVLVSVVRSPGLVRSYYRSWKRSRTAAFRLGRALAGLVGLSAEELGAVAESISYYKT